MQTVGYLGEWTRALRVHQWLKNLLVLLPVLLAHRMVSVDVLADALSGLGAFCLCASSAYLYNDLRDLEADRAHPRKRLRPFASGALPSRQGGLVAALLLLAALAVGLRLGLAFLAVLVLYYVVTLAYSLWFKRIAVLDVMTLAGLYTLRLLAGGAATHTAPSFWLLSFSMFLFLSLAIVKRATELDGAPIGDSELLPGRGYGRADAAMLMSLGPAAGYMAVLVLALYINSPESQVLYHHPRALWLVCPVLLYWITRIWVLTARGRMNDDPVIFAITDRVSLALGALILCAGYFAR